MILIVDVCCIEDREYIEIGVVDGFRVVETMLLTRYIDL